MAEIRKIIRKARNGYPLTERQVSLLERFCIERGIEILIPNFGKTAVREIA